MNARRNRTQLLGLLLIVAGAIFLLAQFFGWNLSYYGWPLFILVPGLIGLAAAFFGGVSAAGLFVPGSVVTTVGLILFVQSLSGRFESWAYAWALIPTAVGLGLMLQGERTENPLLRQRGGRMAATFALFFLAFTLFFEGFIYNNLFDTWAVRFALPLLLIAAGAILLWQRRGDKGES